MYQLLWAALPKSTAYVSGGGEGDGGDGLGAGGEGSEGGEGGDTGGAAGLDGEQPLRLLASAPSHVRGTAHEVGRLRALTHRIVWLARR